MTDQKYIKTVYGEIIIFPASRSHSEFKEFTPTSAGFIKFLDGAVFYKLPSCICYGESKSLGLKADVEMDSQLALGQLFGINDYLYKKYIENEEVEV